MYICPIISGLFARGVGLVHVSQSNPESRYGRRRVRKRKYVASRERSGTSAFCIHNLPPRPIPSQRQFMAARHFSAALLSGALPQAPLVEAGLSRNKRVTPVSHNCLVVVAGTKCKWKYVPRIRRPGRTSLQPLIGDNRSHGFFRKLPADCDVLQGLTNISAD